MASKVKNTRPARRPARPLSVDEVAKAAAAEASLIAKHGSRIVPGTVHRAKNGTKMMVTINTLGLDGKPDGGTRVVATSDVFQCLHQKGVKKALKSKKTADKAAKRSKAKA